MKLVIFALLVASVSATLFAPKQNQNTAKAELMNNLLRRAEPVDRELHYYDFNMNMEDFLPNFSIKFEKCHVLHDPYDAHTHHVAIFRFCPKNIECESCDFMYGGEFFLTLDDYLKLMTNHYHEQQAEMCQSCSYECADADYTYMYHDMPGHHRKLHFYNSDCDTCYDECQKIENMEENGYVDATEFLGCQMIYDPEDHDAKSALYAGPICASDGEEVKIGVFKDEDCLYMDRSKDVDDYLVNNDGYHMKTSHAILKHTYREDTCVSCAASDDENAPKISQVCDDMWKALFPPYPHPAYDDKSGDSYED